MVSTDGAPDNVQDALTAANEIRAGDPAPNYRPQGKICSVLVGGTCADPPGDTSDCFLRRLANTGDSANNCAQPPAGPEYPDQPEGQFSCATDSSDYPPLLDSYVEDFVLLCVDCACNIIHAGGSDCNQNGVLDFCESGDCDMNDIPDVCDLLSDPSLDCNENDVLDECDIATGYSEDCDENGVPDECQANSDGGEFIDACDNCPTVTNPGQEDCDNDGVGDACETDTDSDDVPDDCDNCPTVANPGQENCDNDSEGDACDSDDDNDGIADEIDNCDCVPNVDQLDCDGDGVGNACDPGGYPLVDFDDDCDVDQVDFSHLQECLTGGWTISPECQDAYVSGTLIGGSYPMIAEGDVVLFERCASGPGILADPSCGDCNSNGIIDALEDFDTDTFPDGDADGDGVDVRGRSPCVNGDTGTCDDNCPCQKNSNQADNNGRSDGDGVGDACEPPPPAPPVTIQVLAWRSMREHGTGNWLGVALDPTLTADSATIEPRQGSVQVIEADLSDAAGASSDLGAVLVFDDEFNLITPNDVYLDSGNTKVVITFIDDPLVNDDFLLDQKCYLIDLSLAIVDTEGDPPIGDANCAIRMLAADVDGDGIVEEVDDEGAIEAANGQAAGSSNVRLDVNVDGVINATDESIATGLIGNTVTCSGGMMMMGMGGANEGVGTSQTPDLLTLLQGMTAPPPSANVSAQWVVHETGATTVTLPATGGTVAVDLVVTTDAPIWGFEGKPAVDAADTVSINSADWTELDNVLMSYGQTVTSTEEAASQPPTTLASYYDLTVMDWLWVRLTPDASDVTAWGMDVDSLLGADPPTVWTLTQDLTVINGPIATPAVDPAIEAQDSAQWFTTTAGIGGVTREPLPAGQTVLATLSLTISAQPGTYHLTLTDPQFTDTTHVTFPATAGQPLVIAVGQ